MVLTTLLGTHQQNWITCYYYNFSTNFDPIPSTLKVEAAYTYEMSLSTNYTTRCQNPEDYSLNNPCHANPKTYFKMMSWHPCIFVIISARISIHNSVAHILKVHVFEDHHQYDPISYKVCNVQNKKWTFNKKWSHWTHIKNHDSLI
jgi:hypothetical protein